MTLKEIANYYKMLTNGEKGRFTAFVSCHVGGSPHTWQQKFLGWGQDHFGRPLSPVVEKELVSIIEKERWKIK